MAAAERNRAGPRARGDASLGRVGTPPGRLAGGAVVGATSLRSPPGGRGAGRGCREALRGSQTDSAPCPVPSAWETRRPVGTVAVTGFQVRGSRGLEAGTAPGPTPSSGPWLPTSVIRGDVTRLRRPPARSAGAPGRRRVAAAVHPASAGRLGAERADAGHPAHAVATALPLRLVTRGELHSHSVSKPGGAIGLP